MGRTTAYASRPSFALDSTSLTRESGRQIDWRYVPESYRTGYGIVKLNGAVSVDATSITVDALPVALLPGQLLYFGEAKEFVKVTAPAAVGATTVTVEAVPTALEDNDEATVGGTNAKVVKAGTVMAELSGGKVVPRTNRPASETSIGILETDAQEGDRGAALTGYGLVVGGVVFENLLMEATGTPAVISSTYKTELQTAGVGTGFAFRQYADNRT